MIADRNHLWYVALVVTGVLACEVLALSASGDGESKGPEARLAISPRIENNEWKPVGRSDPLKNDPTYDYSPPVLDRVRYWADNSNSNTHKAKGDVLLLGVPSKRAQNTIRRSYYPHLSMHLMPPPIQALSSSTAKPYYAPSSPNAFQTNPNSGWMATGKKIFHDTYYDESVNSYVSVASPPTASSMIRPSMNEIKPSALVRKPWVHDLLKKELVKSTFAPPTAPSTMSTPVYITSTSPEPLIMSTTEQVFPTIAPSIEHTTDSIFAHYKQPAQALNGPLYLIIEGHSKVKTYGGTSDQEHSPKIVPVTPTNEAVIQHVVLSDAEGAALNIRHLHTKTTTTTTPAPKKSEKLQEDPSTMDNLLSLLDSSLGDIFRDEHEANSTTAAPSAAVDDEFSRDIHKRQVFDYDLLSASRLKDPFADDYEDNPQLRAAAAEEPISAEEEADDS